MVDLCLRPDCNSINDVVRAINIRNTILYAINGGKVVDTNCWHTRRLFQRVQLISFLYRGQGIFVLHNGRGISMTRSGYDLITSD